MKGNKKTTSAYSIFLSKYIICYLENYFYFINKRLICTGKTSNENIHASHKFKENSLRICDNLSKKI